MGKDILVDRILTSVNSNVLASISYAWELFNIESFDCRDIRPTLGQLQLALNKAKSLDSSF